MRSWYCFAEKQPKKDKRELLKLNLADSDVLTYSNHSAVKGDLRTDWIFCMKNSLLIDLGVRKHTK